MNIAIIGATGFVGSALLNEALLNTDLLVTGVVRKPEVLLQHPRLRPARADVQHTDSLAAVLRGHDAVIHAFQPQRDSTDIYEQVVAGHRSIIAATRLAGIQRLVAVGGAASLLTPDGVEYLESPLWDKAFDPYRPAIMGTRALYYLLKEESELDWAFIAPSALLRPGERSLKYRVGKDHMLFDAEGHSRISLEDYAAAFMAEVQRPQHHRERFTVGY
jgi:putative NADH-flavin reductase